MTYLELINRVLTRLRLDTAADLSESYTLLVGQFVNQAKEEIEAEGPWKALRSEVTVTTAAATDTYTITGTNERSYVLRGADDDLEIFETTTGSHTQVEVIDWEDMRQLKKLEPSVTSGRPTYVAFDKTSTGLRLQFYPTPDSIRTYAVTCVIPQAELSVASTSMSIPGRPVWMLAAFYAAQERGAELSGELTEAKARDAVQAAILNDFGLDTRGFYPD
jgi:hypothetical protein